MASVSLRKICSTWVVATCPAIFVSILIDLMGRARGRVTGRGGVGHRRQGPGTITPCAEATAAAAMTSRNKVRQMKVFLITHSFEGFGMRRQPVARVPEERPPRQFLAEEMDETGV